MMKGNLRYATRITPSYLTDSLTKCGSFKNKKEKRNQTGNKFSLPYGYLEVQ
jgi:hypothetical protein